MKSVAKLKALTAQHQAAHDSARTRKVFRFLEAKGLFFAYPRPKWQGKLSVRDCAWVAEHVEPRVWEVLPAALLRFPKSFSGRPDAELLQVLENIREGGRPSFKGIDYSRIETWLNAPLADKRTKAYSEKKILKAFRLSPNAANALSTAAAKFKLSESEMLERAILESKSLYSD